jgi:PAS domain-containing protein
LPWVSSWLQEKPTIPCGTYGCSNGGVVEWNRGSEELYGYRREEALGKQKERLLGTTVPGSSFGRAEGDAGPGELRQ